MIYGDVCSGISATTAAWKPLGWRCAFYSEIDPFPRAVLEHHHPETPLHGDFTTIEQGQYEPIDLLVGGTPCQDFSVAGLRAGMAGDRGNLTLQFLTLARRLRPEWVVWENVPGVLSSNGGRDFGAFLGGLGELGYGWAYRTLDAQHFGVPQRRRRVFVVGYLGDWRRAAAVLFERHCLQGHPAPRREAGEGVAPTIAARTKGGGGLGTDFDCDGGLIVGVIQYGDKTGPLDTDAYTHGVMTIQNATRGKDQNGLGIGADQMFTLDQGSQHAVAFAQNQRGEVLTKDIADSLKVGGGKPGQGYLAAMQGMAVRRLTPRECERLQGFADDFTLVPYRGKPAADEPRYKALGNSMAVPVVAWLGQRIKQVMEIA